MGCWSVAGVVRHNDGEFELDAFHFRVTRLDSSGQDVSVTKIPPRTWVNTSSVGAFGNCVLVQIVESGFRGEGDIGPLEARPKVEFAIVRLSDGVVTMETTRPGVERWAQRIGRTHGGLPVIFGRQAVSAVTDRRACWGIRCVGRVRFTLNPSRHLSCRWILEAASALSPML